MTNVQLPTTGGEPYCEIDSTGAAATNLQLYSLHQAYKYWKKLEAGHSELTKEELREQAVLICSLLGTSLCQLLGQNETPHMKP